MTETITNVQIKRRADTQLHKTYRDALAANGNDRMLERYSTQLRVLQRVRDYNMADWAYWARLRRVSERLDRLNAARLGDLEICLDTVMYRWKVYEAGNK